MLFNIYFCVDGVLRATPLDSKGVLIPLTFIQQNENKSDLAFWGQWWHSSVIFEKGLTVAQFLRCIAPWAHFWGELTQTDISAYISEMRKPHLVSHLDESEDKIDWINLSVMTTLKPEISYAPDDSILAHSFKVNEWLNAKKQTQLTGEWHIDSVYALTGYVIGKEEHYAVDYMPMNKLANLPLVLDDKQYIVIDDHYLKAILSDEQLLLKETAFSVCKMEDCLTYLVSKKRHSMRDVMDGFFENLSQTPVLRDELTATLKESLSAIDYADTLAENSTESDETNKESNEGHSCVKVMPGVFDSLIEDEINFNRYWNKLKTMASKDKTAVLRINSPLKGVAPEKRIYKYIMDEKENNTLPMPSDYKLF